MAYQTLQKDKNNKTWEKQAEQHSKPFFLTFFSSVPQSAERKTKRPGNHGNEELAQESTGGIWSKDFPFLNGPWQPVSSNHCCKIPCASSEKQIGIQLHHRWNLCDDGLCCVTFHCGYRWTITFRPNCAKSLAVLRKSYGSENSTTSQCRWLPHVTWLHFTPIHPVCIWKCTNSSNQETHRTGAVGCVILPNQSIHFGSWSKVRLGDNPCRAFATTSLTSNSMSGSCTAGLGLSSLCPNSTDNFPTLT